MSTGYHLVLSRTRWFRVRPEKRSEFQKELDAMRHCIKATWSPHHAPHDADNFYLCMLETVDQEEWSSLPHPTEKDKRFSITDFLTYYGAVGEVIILESVFMGPAHLFKVELTALKIDAPAESTQTGPVTVGPHCEPPPFIKVERISRDFAGVHGGQPYNATATDLQEIVFQRIKNRLYNLLESMP
jgi:hypothetical protein